MTDNSYLLGNLPLQYTDGPDYCTVKDATGGDFALTAQPELMRMMEDALRSRDVAAGPSMDDVLSVLHTYRDYQPEEDESWESWYYAAFDLACMKIRELFGKPALAAPQPAPVAPDHGWLQPALDKAAERAADMPRWMTRTTAQPQPAPAQGEVEAAFVNLCGALGLQPTPSAYLDAPAARAAIAAPPQAAPQTIAGAPRDGSHILAWRIPIGIRVTNNTHPPTVVHWFDDPDEPGFYTSVNERAPEHPFEATHWSPLPAGPSVTRPNGNTP